MTTPEGPYRMRPCDGCWDISGPGDFDAQAEFQEDAE